MSARNSLQRANVRPGDFHLRSDSRQMFGNYVQLSPLGGSGTVPNLRRSASVVETPVYSEPKLWQIALAFDAGVNGTIALSPWVPSQGTSYSVVVKVRAALDRDKNVATDAVTLLPADNLPAALGGLGAFPERFQAAHQLGVNVEVIGTTDVVLGVQASVVAVDAGERDAYGNAERNLLGTPAGQPYQQSNVTQQFLAANANRRQFFVVNWGTAPLFVQFGQLASGPAGGPPSFAFALPSRGDVYESPRDCWQGDVSGVWSVDSADAGDFAMVTEGT